MFSRFFRLIKMVNPLLINKSSFPHSLKWQFPFCSTNRLLLIPQNGKSPFVQQVDFYRFFNMALYGLFNDSTFPHSSKWWFPFCSTSRLLQIPQNGKSPFVKQVDFYSFLNMALYCLFNDSTFPSSSKRWFLLCSTSRLLRIPQNGRFPFVQQLDFSTFLETAIPLLFHKSTFNWFCPDSSKWQFPFCSSNRRSWIHEHQLIKRQIIQSKVNNSCRGPQFFSLGRNCLYLYGTFRFVRDQNIISRAPNRQDRGIKEIS